MPSVFSFFMRYLPQSWWLQILSAQATVSFIIMIEFKSRYRKCYCTFSAPAERDSPESHPARNRAESRRRVLRVVQVSFNPSTCARFTPRPLAAYSPRDFGLGFAAGAFVRPASSLRQHVNIDTALVRGTTSRSL
jgi:hypothetical protein